MKKRHRRVLVLNTDCRAISTVSWKRAIVLAIQNQEDFNKGYIVMDYYSAKVRTAGGLLLPIPAVVRLAKYQKHRKKRVSFSRKNLFLRDNLTCQYCGYQDLTGSTLTYDHVISRKEWKDKKYPGTPTSWTNIVCCCRKCNLAKNHTSLVKSGMKLLTGKMPIEPNPHSFILGVGPWTHIPKQWVPYLPPFYQELMKTQSKTGV